MHPPCTPSIEGRYGGTVSGLGRWGSLPTEPSMPLPVDKIHLDRAGHRDRAQGAEDAGDLRADEHGDQHRQRGELHGPPVDERLEQVVLDLLVDDEEPITTRSPRGPSAGTRRGRRGSAASVAPASGTRSRRATTSPSATANGTPMIEQHDRRQCPGDQADEQVACHVAAHRAVDVAPDARQRGRDCSGSSP